MGKVTAGYHTHLKQGGRTMNQHTQTTHTIRFRKYAGGPVHSIKVRGELSEVLQGMRTRYKSIDILRTHSPVGRVVTRSKRKQEGAPQNDTAQATPQNDQPLPTPNGDKPLFDIPLFL